MFVCCRACEEVGEACSSFCCPTNRPSPIFSIYTSVFNVVIGILIISQLTGSSGDCTSSAKTWNIVALVVCIVNIIFGIYIYMRFWSKMKEGLGAFQGATKLFMYDIGVYFYIWFVVFIIVWCIMSSSMTKDETVCTSLAETGWVVSCFIVFLGGSILVIWLSLLTECCKTPKWAPPEGVATTQAQPVGYQPMPTQGGYPPSTTPPPVNPAYAQPQVGQPMGYATPYGQPYGQQPPPQQQRTGLSGMLTRTIGKIL